MYRCTECKEEFKEKPEYCTCGNDEFEEFTAPPVKGLNHFRKSSQHCLTGISILKSLTW